jgi:hypothetical protein
MKLLLKLDNMKYIFIVILLLCLVLIPVMEAHAAPQKYEECNPGGYEFTPWTGNGRWRAQTFTATSTHLVTSVKVRIKRFGSPGEVVLSIRNADPGPTGGDLVSKTLINPGTGGLSWEEFVFPSAFTVEEGNLYAICIRTPNQPVPDADYVGWAAHFTNQCDGGKHWYSDDGGSYWSDSTTYDQHFEVWGEPPPPPPPPPVGGELYPVDKLAVTMPWITLIAIIAGGIGIFLVRRKAHKRI